MRSLFFGTVPQRVDSFWIVGGPRHPPVSRVIPPLSVQLSATAVLVCPGSRGRPSPRALSGP